MEHDAYVTRRRTLIEYLRMKVDQEDWHGAADACCDLRELDAEERGHQERPRWARGEGNGTP